MITAVPCDTRRFYVRLDSEMIMYRFMHSSEPCDHRGSEPFRSDTRGVKTCASVAQIRGRLRFYTFFTSVQTRAVLHSPCHPAFRDVRVAATIVVQGRARLLAPHPQGLLARADAGRPRRLPRPVHSCTYRGPCFARGRHQALAHARSTHARPSTRLRRVTNAPRRYTACR